MTTRFIVAFPTRRFRRCVLIVRLFPAFLRSRLLCFLFLLLIDIFSYGVLVPVCQVMHAAAYHSQPPPVTKGHTDPLYASVGHLLSKACSNTCFTAAQAFAQLVQPTARFQLALDALLPILDSQRSEVSGLLVALSAESIR
jgi:hypothetical protein